MPPTTRRSATRKDALEGADKAPGSAIAEKRQGKGEEDEGDTKRMKRSESGKADEAEEEVQRVSVSTLPPAAISTPGTLLAIAQTRKSIRSTLFRKVAEPVWRGARRSVGLDILSGKLDEPTYAYLLYGTTCQCLETNICLALDIEAENVDLHPLTFQCCLSTPFSHEGKRSVSRKPFYWKPEVFATSALLHVIDPIAARTDRRKAHPSQAALDLKRDFGEYASVVHGDAKVFPDCVERAWQRMLQDEEDRAIWRLRQYVTSYQADGGGLAKEDTLAIPDCFKNSSTDVDDTYWTNNSSHADLQPAHPGTLLAIGQTSKSIRSTLFRKSADPIWVTARNNVGPPELREVMAEPVYACLLYGKACEVCGTTKRQTTPRFDLQVRACSNICPPSNIEKKVDDVHPLTLKCCLSTPYSHTGKRSVSRKPFYWLPDVDRVSEYIYEIDPVAARTDRTKIHLSEAAVVFQADCDAFKEAAKADDAIFKEGVKLFEKAKLADEREREKWRFRQIQARFMLAGFKKEDTLATPLPVKKSSCRVDDGYWEQVKDGVIKAVEKARDERMQ
ncbi:hypothetical protein Rt10032_c03g1385 [Rhodotorula toruloides]|uniref:Uncharacterized protein n=1 Tax=Rhodotorula toruloides TaxID=5286 RepID=A0A511KAI2_RHOTO|nr:hypothetical protein Rt10032_c03g1385 [Rhodotorula toruloides]